MLKLKIIIISSLYFIRIFFIYINSLKLKNGYIAATIKFTTKNKQIPL